MLEGLAKIYKAGPFAIYRGRADNFDVTYDNKIIHTTEDYNNALKIISSADVLRLDCYTKDILYIYSYIPDSDFKIHVNIDTGLYAIIYDNEIIDNNIPFNFMDECIKILELLISTLPEHNNKKSYTGSAVKEYYEKIVKEEYKVEEVVEKEKSSVNISANIIGIEIKSYSITTASGKFTVVPPSLREPAKLYKNIIGVNTLLYTSDNIETLISMIVLNKIKVTDIFGLEVSEFDNCYIYKDLFKIDMVTENLFIIWNLRRSGKDSKENYRFENLKDAVDYVKIILKSI